MKNKQASVFGGACIIAGVCVGAGMLGLPTVGAGPWIFYACAIITVCMIFMTLSGCLLLDVYKHYDYAVSYNTVTQDLLGKSASVINNLSVYFVGAILLYAYTSSLGSSLAEPLHLTPRLASVVSVVLCSAVVWWSTRAVDRVSVLLIILMVLTFIFSVSGLLGHMQWHILADSYALIDAHYSKYALALLPVSLTSFGYHHSVTSLRLYYRDERKAKWAIAGGTTIALTLYLVWMIGVFGNLPRHEFASVIAANGEVKVLIEKIGASLASESVRMSLQAFSLAAIISSFIGVGLGVFDYLADLFKIDTTQRKGRSQVWALTFILPLVFSLVAPFGFVQAIAFAGVACTIWTCITPALLHLKLRRRSLKRPTSSSRLPLLLSWGLLFVGLLTLLVQGLYECQLLPVFRG
ncbi:aromatic amino acid transporter [Brackiella oedipodis]|uniref:aromatic amino acid transporter n=1 Tax=Brackiella oedipodis TaxID=124225 RepID=UPI00048CFB95|nr:aromatic amino acid transporter [Brackiella oedipodis]